MRVALVVGIDYYISSPLFGCVNDARAVKSVLAKEGNGTWNRNFDVILKTAYNQSTAISRAKLKEDIKKLFEQKIDTALFYFSGHGYIQSTGGYLITSESKLGDDGLPMNELLQIVNDSPAINKIIMLDCCHSGIIGNQTPKDDKAILTEGVVILAASTKDQYALEKNGSGVFTGLLVDALKGSAANLVGDITPGSVYAHIDQSLGPWDQRPIFKANVNRFVKLRKVKAPISLANLKMITRLFPDKTKAFPLNPTYEPTSSTAIAKNVGQFEILQKYNKINLVVPVDAEHMYYAAINSTSCKLTFLGQHYWNLIKNERI